MVKKILIVDDEPHILMMLSARLKAAGYSVEKAADGENGIRKAQECVPDIILLDIFMPKLDGYEVCKRLKEDPVTSHIPIIMVTASGEKNLFERSYNAGADDVVRKPYDSKMLLEKIKKILLKTDFSPEEKT